MYTKEQNLKVDSETRPSSSRKNLGRRVMDFIGIKPRSERSMSAEAKFMELNGFVRDAPVLLDQIQDKDGRQNLVESHGRYHDAQVRDMGIRVEQTVLSEADNIQGLAEFLLEASKSNALNPEDRLVTGDMLRHLTVIGNKEMTEASRGIAALMKHQLNSDADLQILLQIIDQQSGASDDGRSKKSAGYVLRKVLDNFSEEDLERYKGRIIFDIHDVRKNMRTKALLLDDWSISGTQMRQMYDNLTLYGDMGVDEIEACLVAAPGEAIERGLDVRESSRLPVKAYYRLSAPAHQAGMGKAIAGDVYPGYVTGTHSSVDFNFDRYIGKLVSQTEAKQARGLNIPEILTKMPPLTQISRPYLGADYGKYHRKIEKINRDNGHSFFDFTHSRWVFR